MTKTYKEKEDSPTENKAKRKSRHDKETINYYEVFGCEQSVSQKELRQRYRDLVQKYHPDKNKDKDPKLFELVQRAWESLCTEDKRKQYDQLLSNVQQAKRSDHHSLKQSYEEYAELSKSDVSEKTKEVAKLEFEKGFSEMDKKHKFDRSKMKDNAIDTQDAKKRVNDLVMSRDQDAIEFSQPKMFEDGKPVPLAKFNEMFDLWKQKKDRQIVKSNGAPSAFNDVTSSSYSSVGAFGDAYQEGEEITGNDKFGSVNFGSEQQVELDPEDVKKLSGARYVTDHNKKDDKYNEDLRKRMAEYNQQTEVLTDKTKMTFDKFVTDPAQSYMFTHNVGAAQLEYNGDDDLMDACNKLIELEKS
jgi:curved DNA-binding protein CbpA